MADRIPSKRFTGVYYRESTRKHGSKPDRIYCFTFRDTLGRQRWTTVGRASEGITEAFANQKRIETINMVNHGENPAERRKKVATLADVFEACMEHDEANGRDVSYDRSRFNSAIRPEYGDFALDDFTPAIADKFKADLMRKGNTPATVVQVLGLVRKTINHATRSGLWTGQNVFSKSAGFTMPKVQNKGERWLTENEARQLLDALEIRSQQLHDMARLSLLYGLRATELFDLRHQDIDHQGEVLHVLAKGRRQKVLVDTGALEILSRYDRKPGEYVFQARRGGRLKEVSDTFGRAVDSLGLNDGIEERTQKVWFHTLRHTWASWLAQSGSVSLHELMELGRWENYEMVLRYAHLIPDHRREKLAIATKRLEAASAGQPSEPHDP
ncbi:hypothetical protein DPQ33_13865 [Oceanidesulfovibrio indonesiensis]|uniref:Tyr recombinase domain-containing protein n=1 Tax=Oceanidesulfovibrio indonesiensis TaxID=54767 RepID=A0A7M3MCM4_9BACT|nr:site-specific integrase [Oceanidesulfovibrio indonesiensis]TVM15787.1 hypothetical protein DPQ33_13865 [Oceanidesulfovibrio indonesiensis]